jgi:hypothetical protein
MIARAGTIKLPVDMLKSMLGLNDEHKVYSLHRASGRVDGLEMVVEGPLMPEINEGELAPYVELVIKANSETGKPEAVKAKVIE